MSGDADLARVGSLVADPKRAKMLLALLGGEATSASALADAAGASRSLASAHLRKLVDGGLVSVEPQGRRRLYRIAGQPVADALEGLIRLSPPTAVRSLRDANRKENLRRARLCYDHLAGVLGVAVTEALVGRGALAPRDGGFAVTRDGGAVMAEIDVDVEALERGRRPLTRACMDWTERRPHLGGALGAAMTSSFLGRRWIEHGSAGRIVRVTPAGRRGLRAWAGVQA
ncbi:MAG TPA: helix-turn-helix transcriptional regulator [Solirubrobacteraceae bacterium]|nr:helix-turn-helix transcriptional regulator [Solirubrobacteraceae bacterium]